MRAPPHRNPQAGSLHFEPNPYHWRMKRHRGLIVRTLARLTCALLSLTSLPTSVQAADGKAAPRKPYLRLYSGVGITGDSDLRIHQPALGTDLTFEQVSWEHKSLSTQWTRDSSPYVGVRGGFFLREPQWLALSIEVLHFKILAEEEKIVHVRGTHQGMQVDTVAPMEQFVQRYRVSNGVNMILSNVEAHTRLAKTVRFPDGRADLYGGLGVGVTVPYTNSAIDGQSQGQYEWGRLATQVLGGVSWYMSRRWDISLEYKFTLTTVDGRVAGGDSRSRLRTHHLTFGLSYHFKRPAPT